MMPAMVLSETALQSVMMMEEGIIDQQSESAPATPRSLPIDEKLVDMFKQPHKTSSFVSLTPSTSSTEASSSSSLSGDDVEVVELLPPTILAEEYDQESFIDVHVLPKIFTGYLPRQSDSTKWLKYLLPIVILQIGAVLIGTELSTQVFLKLDATRYVDLYAQKMFTDPLIIALNVVFFLVTLGRTIVTDCIACAMLLHGKQRRVLPKDKRLVHAVVVTQYKEPLEVLDATVSSLAESTLAHSTIVVLACEERDPNADEVFDVLEQRYSHYFQDMIKSVHRLEEGEVAGCSSNENCGARTIYKYAMEQGLDPFRVMLTICDADSLFDPVYLEHVEAEYWRTAGGERSLYNAPINTYRNLSECDMLVQACEISRNQDDLFSGLDFRPAQSNYSLTLGFAHEIDFWDPSNTSEDFHTTLKAMALTGQGTAIVVRIWSLILNDSVGSFGDRWTQAKRHMWGIEECAWTFESFSHLRFVRWLSIAGLTIKRMLFCANTIPPYLILLCPSVRTFLVSLTPETIQMLTFWMAVLWIGHWIQAIVREIFLRRYILADRKHMMPAGWRNWCMLFTVYPIVERLAVFVFFTCTTWVMLWRALWQESIVYVVAPKALVTPQQHGEDGGVDDLHKNGNKKSA